MAVCASELPITGERHGAEAFDQVPTRNSRPTRTTTYNYERGEYATHELSWNDAARHLTVGPREGSFPGMTRTRTLNVVLAAPGQNQGTGGAAGRAKRVLYDGQQVEIDFAGYVIGTETINGLKYLDDFLSSSP